MQAAGHGEDAMSEERFLEAYKKKEYPKPSLTADIAVFRQGAAGLEILMVRRGKHPFKGCWALPGGFVNPDEDVMDAAARELEEETGVAGAPIELFGIYGAPGRDPRGWTVSGGFCALMGDDVRVEAGDDAADARWCAVVETVADPVATALRAPQAPEAEPAHAVAPEGSLHTLEVRCAEGEAPCVRFYAVPQKFGAPRASLVDGAGFAFDHAQLVADAYLKVTQGLDARRR